MAAAGTVVPDDATTQLMARIAESRARGWLLVAEILDEPDPVLVDRLRTGRWLQEFSEATAWLGDGATRFDRWSASLGVFARRSRRVPAEQDLASLRAEHERLGTPQVAAMLQVCRELSASCRAEAVAWRTGDHLAAKDVRVAQGKRVDTDLLVPLTRWAHEADAGATALVTRMLAGMVASWLAVETGRPIDAGLLPGMAVAEDNAH